MLIPQSCLILCDPMHCNPLGVSVYRVLQTRILEWVAIQFSGGFSQPRDWTWVSYISCIGGGFFTVWDTREALSFSLSYPKCLPRVTLSIEVCWRHVCMYECSANTYWLYACTRNPARSSSSQLKESEVSRPDWLNQLITLTNSIKEM